MRAAICCFVSFVLLAGCSPGDEARSTTEVTMVVHVPCVTPPCTAGSDVPAPTEAPAAITGRPPATMLALGWDHSCALASDGSVWCWGDNHHAQLADIGMDSTPVPARVPSLPPMAAIWAGANQTCGRARDDGQLWCWGETGLGAAQEPTFAQPLPFAGVRTVGLAYRKGCFIDEQGALYCWGDYGRPHGPVWNAPTRVPLRDAVSLQGGMSRTCARTSRGEVTCWGLRLAYAYVEHDGDLFWRLPDLRGVALLAFDDFTPHPTTWIVDRRGRVLEATPRGRDDVRTGTRRLQLRALPGLEDVVELDAGGGHYCARTSAGTAACWGHNNAGQVGDGTTAMRVEPVFLNLSSVEEIAVGKSHSCARAQGRLYCWGSNDRGQVGVQGSREVLEPIEVPW